MTTQSCFAGCHRPAGWPRRVAGFPHILARAAIGLMLASGGFLVWAGVPRALPAGQLPDDVRLGPLKDLNGYFPFHPPATVAAWHQRARAVRHRMRVALGLWPMPTRTPLHAAIYDWRDCGDYLVAKVHFESLPGFYVTGNLYRPKGKTGRMPGVLCPHGHWPDGRFHEDSLADVKREIAQGAEKYEDGGRAPIQARCVGLARMGCVVFQYDMLGYADSIQIPMAIAHQFAKQRPAMDTLTDWGLFSPQAEAHFQSVMGLQTWDSIRSLDFLMSLPDVDPHRIAVTGASGGGTQTYILCGVDPRPTLAFPAVMVSTAMQGGCTCENACDLRIGTGNVEFAALFAPKPLGMTCANDWTKEMPTKGFPQLKQLYTMLGAPDHVMLHEGLQFGHNYNLPSREAMYEWVNRFFHLGQPEPIHERDFHALGRRELTVWDATHPRPVGGPAFERHLLAWLDADAQLQLAKARRSLRSFRRMYGGGIDVVIDRTFAKAGEVQVEQTGKTDYGDYVESVGVVRNLTYHEEVPGLAWTPKEGNGQAVLWLSAAGKAGLANPDGTPRPEIRRLLAAGTTVIGADLFMQGEFLTNGEVITHTRRVNNPREAAAYTFGYNDSLFAQRVHDILTMLKAIRDSQRFTSVALVGLGHAGPWAAAALAVARGAVDAAAIDTGGFRFGHILNLWDVNFLPGGAKYGDVPGMLALGAPDRLWLAGEKGAGANFVREQYARAGAADHLSVFTGQASSVSASAVDWLLRQQ